MKVAALFILLVIHQLAPAQTQETYYSYDWKLVEGIKAVFFSQVLKTDSGWLKLDYFMGNQQLHMKTYFKDSDCKIKHGPFMALYSNGNLSAVGEMADNKQDGICFSYHKNGMMSDSAFFKKGKHIGTRLKWHPNGFVSDSLQTINDSTNVWVSWFDDGAPSSAGYTVDGKKNGKWNYFHRNGTIAAKVSYTKGYIITEEYFDEDGKAMDNKKAANREASYKKGGEEGWRAYVQKNLYWPFRVELKSHDEVTVVVSFTINEEGKVEDAFVDIPVHPEFDKIALKLIKNSPGWDPAIFYNRKIKSYRKQPMTFHQVER